ncbi:MAG: PAS domain S-box protein [Planctomycetota bacterium]|nr:PAS domain S-box protein [Planctomycetota bacterium]
MRHLSNPQDRERLLRAILEHSEMGVWHADAKGRTLYVNPAGCRWMGVKRDAALLGRSYQEFVAPESWTGMRKEWAKRRQGIASSYELEMIRPDGRRINLLACGVPVPGSLPGAYTVVGLLLNVTAMKRTETELRRSEELLQRIVENVPAGVVYAASDGRIQRANSVAQEFLGLSYRKLKACFAADWNGTTLREDGSPFPAAEYPVTRCLKTGRAQGPATIGIRRPDGKVRWGYFPPPRRRNPDPAGAAARS